MWLSETFFHIRTLMTLIGRIGTDFFIFVGFVSQSFTESNTEFHGVWTRISTGYLTPVGVCLSRTFLSFCSYKHLAFRWHVEYRFGVLCILFQEQKRLTTIFQISDLFSYRRGLLNSLSKPAALIFFSDGALRFFFARGITMISTSWPINGRNPLMVIVSEWIVFLTFSVSMAANDNLL